MLLRPGDKGRGTLADLNLRTVNMQWSVILFRRANTDYSTQSTSDLPPAALLPRSGQTKPSHKKANGALDSLLNISFSAQIAASKVGPL